MPKITGPPSSSTIPPPSSSSPPPTSTTEAATVDPTTPLPRAGARASSNPILAGGPPPGPVRKTTGIKGRSGSGSNRAPAHDPTSESTPSGGGGGEADAWTDAVVPEPKTGRNRFHHACVRARVTKR